VNPVVILILVVIALVLAILSLVPFASNYPLVAVAVILLAVAMLAGSAGLSSFH
jgi:hypothetical protein